MAVLCPSCLEWRKSPVTVSMTIFNLRQWSDGYATHSLDSAPARFLRACECGAIFAVNKTERQEISRDVIPVGAVFPIALHEAEFFVAERGPHQRDVELSLRKLAWWHSNRDKRCITIARDELPRPETYRPDWMPCPAACTRFSPADHRSNIGRIAELLLGGAEANWMLVGDARRQLGEYGAAISAYEQMPPSAAGWKKHLIKQARRGADQVVELSRVAHRDFFSRIFSRSADATVSTEAI